jgi:hypothetical protein
MVIIFVVVICRTGYWRTDRRGITHGGIRREEFVAWDEITDAYSDQRGRISWTIHLTVHDHRISVDVHDAHLKASISMYLRLYGMADRIDPPVDVAALLRRPPEDAIPDMRWSLKHRLAWYRTAYAALFAVLMVYAIVYFARKILSHESDHIVMDALFCLWCPWAIWRFGLSAWRGTFTAKSFLLSRDRFVVRTIWGTAEYRWNAVTDAFWVGCSGTTDNRLGVPSPSKMAVVLCMGSAHVVCVPWNQNDEESTMLLDLIIDRLDLLMKPIHLPTPHQALAGGPGSGR